ncbi:hypothetical protein [Streptomyces sp. NBC_01760]|uniref:hypothetical protein n=1 Tax=Streptomyces sp. NBC_01760 TaxID=2975931 RepID=UPI002DD8EC6C|nr:hypothetical protein [Streptomyces sp. NBC_01760]WSC72226.1 hypothetical protein OG807_29170 [Streptomyces sp. NBC_01760]
MRKSLQVVMLNLTVAAYQSTPGAPVKDYGPQGTGPLGEFKRPITEAEAAERRPDFERLAAELQERDPGTHGAWLADFEFWKSGDVSVRMPRVDDYARREDGLLCFNEHWLINTRETVPYFDDGMAFAYACRRCGRTTHRAGFIGVPCPSSSKGGD